MTLVGRGWGWFGVELIQREILAAVQPKDMSVMVRMGRRDLIQLVFTKWTKQLYKLITCKGSGKEVFLLCSLDLFVFNWVVHWFLLIVELGQLRATVMNFVQKYLLTFQRCWNVRYVHLLAYKGKCALIFSVFVLFYLFFFL